jgi:hypothetical protein
MRLAHFARPAYPSPVAANSAAEFDSSKPQRRKTAERGFFVRVRPCPPVYDGPDGETFGSAGCSVAGLSTLSGPSPFRLTAVVTVLNHTEDLSMANPTQGVSAPTIVIDVPRSIAVSLIGAELIRHRVTRTPESRTRLLAFAEMACALGVVSSSECAAVLAVKEVRHG